jgi:hypothetical protein
MNRRKYSRLLCTTLLACVAAASHAADPTAVPKSLFGFYGDRQESCGGLGFGRYTNAAGWSCSGYGANWLVLEPEPGTGVVGHISLMAHNGHSCRMRDARGKWVKDHVELYWSDGKKECTLHVKPSGGRVMLSDPGHACGELSCSARGSYYGVVLPKRGSL